MCGITGIVGKDSKLSEATVRSAAQCIAHRGPESEGFWMNEEKSVALAHERLKIVDLSEKAAQPMSFLNRYKIIYNEGSKRTCENCKQECLATLYCEICVQNYLITKFSSWTSGNSDVDNLIQNCQMESFVPNMIIEWIPYNNLQNIEYLTKGGFSEIYTADWIDGKYEEWDSKEQQLIKLGAHKVVLKRLENVESAKQSWLEEVCNLNVFKKSNN